jgi:hypothetical protein
MPLSVFDHWYSAMMDRLDYTPKESFIIEISEEGSKHLFLFFTHEHGGLSKWRLTSEIQRIKLTIDKAIITTLNSRYSLYTTRLLYEELSIEEFWYCRAGYTPNEARLLCALTSSQQHTSH